MKKKEKVESKVIIQIFGRLQNPKKGGEIFG